MRLVTIASDDPFLLAEARRLLAEPSRFGDFSHFETEDDPRAVVEGDIVLTTIDPAPGRRLEIIARIRELHAGALVFLAHGLPSGERLKMLEAGVDHIVSAEPGSEELAMVLRNLQRLMLIPAPRHREHDPVAAWILDETEWRLRTPCGHEVPLQRAEAAVLAHLFARPGDNLPREILAASFKSDREDTNRSLDVVISKVRKKVREASGLSLPLRSIRGVGYVFVGNARLVEVLKVGTAG
jgi:DNA-binding response OmpR family regulator